MAGIGTAAVGPGGVLSAVGLVLATDLSPSTVAGTVMVTNLLTGVVGSLAYLRSGHLRDRAASSMTVALLGSAVVGTPLGVLLNSRVPADTFAALLAVFVLVVAGLVWVRGRASSDVSSTGPTTAVVAGVGFVVAVASGVFGVGGPLLMVPLLAALRTPVLTALAVAQVQSIAIAGVGSVGYLSMGAVDWVLAAVIGVPQVLGVLVGWQIAVRVPAVHLRRAMIAVLVVVAPVLLV